VALAVSIEQLRTDWQWKQDLGAAVASKEFDFGPSCRWVHEQVVSNIYRHRARCIVLCNLWLPGTLARTKVVVPLLLPGEYNDKSFVDRRPLTTMMNGPACVIIHVCEMSFHIVK